MDPELLAKLTKMLGDIEAKLNAGGISDAERKELKEGTDRIKALEEAERLRAEREKKSLVVSLPGSEMEMKDFSFAIVAAIAKFGDSAIEADARHSGYAKQFGVTSEIVKATREKALTQGNDVSGGLLVPVQVATAILDKYRASTFIDKLGLTRIPVTGAGELRFPKETGVGTAYYLGENVAASATDSAFGEIVMTQKRLTGMCKVSNRLLRNAPLAVEAFVRRRITKDMAQRANLAFLTGNGAAAPLGILTRSDITTYADAGGNGQVLRFTDIEKIKSILEAADVPTDNLSILTRPEVKRSMKIERVMQYATATTKGQPVMGSQLITDAQLLEKISVNALAVSSLVPGGLTVGSSTDCTYAIVGDFSDAYEAVWGGLMIKSSDVAGDSSGSAFTQDQTWILGQIEHDFAIARPESFIIVNDAKTSVATGE